MIRRQRDRGVSVAVNYAMVIAIATLLMGTLLIGVGDVLDGHRSTAVRSELGVIGQQLASNLMSADRLAQAGGEVVRVDIDFPRTVVGETYRIEINASSSDSTLELSTGERATEVTVQFANTTHVESGTVSGGDLSIVLASDGDLEVRT